MNVEMQQKSEPEKSSNLAHQYAVTIVSELDRYIPIDRRSDAIRHLAGVLHERAVEITTAKQRDRRS